MSKAEKLTAEEIARQILSAGGTIRPASMYEAEMLLKESAKKITDFSSQENKEKNEIDRQEIEILEGLLESMNGVNPEYHYEILEERLNELIESLKQKS